MSLDRNMPRSAMMETAAARRLRLGPAPTDANLAVRGAFFVCTTVLTLMSIQILGPISNVLQLLLLAVLAGLFWRQVVQGLSRSWILLLYPALAVASTFWSSDPDITFRYAIQFFITALAAILVATALAPRSFLAAVYIANVLVVVGSIFSGRYGASMEGPVLIGLTGSKNQMALVCQLTLASAVAVMVDRTQARWLRLSTIGGVIVALILLIQAKSAGGILTAIGTTLAFVGLMLLRPLPRKLRITAVIAGLLIVTPMVVMKDAIVEQAQRISTDVFKKDATLTGRTYLWAQADRLIEQRPAIGHGYRSVWLGKSVTTTGLLRWANLPDGRGFNFHNTFKEVTVDTGFLGLAVFVFTLGVGGFLLFARFLAEGTIVWAFFFATYLSFVARAFAELIVGPFTAGTVILFCMILYAVFARRPGGDELPSVG